MLNVGVSEARGKFTEILDRVHRGKERIAVGNEGEPLAVLVPVEDLKRLENQAEEALRESEARLQAILDNAPAGIYLKDLEGRFITVGKTALAWYGRKAEDVLGRTSYDLVPKEKAEAYASLDRDVIQTRRVVTLEEEEVLYDGETHTIVVTKFPVFGPDGTLMAIGGIDFDITERKRAEAALLQARGDLERRVEARTADLRRANEALTAEIAERARTERALRESEARYRELFDESPVAIWVEDWSPIKQMLDDLARGGVEDWRGYFNSHRDQLRTAYDLAKILDISHATIELYRKESKEHLLRTSAGAAVIDEELDAFREMVLSLLAGQTTVDIESKDTAGDGSEIIVRRRVAMPPKYRDDWSRVIYAIEDITKRKRAEEEVRESEARFKDFAEGANDWIWEMDADLRYTYISASHEQYSGVPPEGVIGYTRSELYARVLSELDPQEVEHWQEFNHLLEARQAFRSFEQRWVRPGGEARYFLISAKPVIDAQGGFVGYRGVGSDITENKRHEELLREELESQVEERTTELSKSELRLRDVVETLPAGLALYDGEDRLALCNETYRGQVFHDRDSIPYGATFEEILKHKLARGHYPLAEGHESDWLAERLRVHRETPGPIEQMHSRGRWFWINERRIGDGSAVVVSTDITERKQAEAELRAAQADLLCQERLATLGQLTATVSHELRNPLGVIRTSAFVVRDGLDGVPARVVRSLERIERSVIRCDRIIDEMLDFSRISELEFETVPIDTWLVGVLEEQVVPREVTVQFEFGLPGVGVGLDSDRLRRAVINVFDNACQAMIAGPSERSENGEHRLTVRTGTAAGRVELIFEDTGPGIPPEVLPRVFEPLFSTKGFGVGLGLSVVHRIMEQHGGGIVIENIAGGGARVRLWLPGDEHGP